MLSVSAKQIEPLPGPRKIVTHLESRNGNYARFQTGPGQTTTPPQRKENSHENLYRSPDALGRCCGSYSGPGMAVFPRLGVWGMQRCSRLRALGETEAAGLSWPPLGGELWQIEN